jgi:hypothetical protein
MRWHASLARNDGSRRHAASAQNILKLSAGTERETRIHCTLLAENCQNPQRVEMTRRVTIVRILVTLFAIIFLNILFHFQLYGEHWPVLAVIPAVILLFFFVLDLIQNLLRALYPAKRWLRVLAWPLAVAGLFVVWWNQPYFGANVCLLKGFMRERDFVEEIRPTIRRIVSRRGVQLGIELPAGVTVAQFVAVADQAVDLLKQCAAERGVNYCRYAGPDPNGVMMDARTVDGPNAIAPEDEYKYRHIKTGLDYDISMVQASAGGSWLSFKVWRFGKPLGAGGNLCYLGCWCNVKYGR